MGSPRFTLLLAVLVAGCCHAAPLAPELAHPSPVFEAERFFATALELNPNCPAAREHLARIPSIAMDPKDTPTTRAATVVFHTATYGINTAGTVYRMDDVPIPLRPAFESPFPSDEEVLRGIERRVRTLKAAAQG